MEMAIAVIGSLIIPILLWLFPPEPLRRLFKFKKRQDKVGSLRFLVRLGDLSNDYWDEVDKPSVVNAIKPFQKDCSQFFQVSIAKFVNDVDPSFDITIISELNSPVVIHKLGVEIESIAHEMKPYAEAQAARISQQASYTIVIPDVRTDIESKLGRFLRLLEPESLNMSLAVVRPDIFRLESGSTFRYELLLKNYVAHMPNYAIVHFWVETQDQRYTSDSIHIFTI